MLKDKKLIDSEIQRIFRSEYEIVVTKQVHALTQFALHYKTLSGSSDMLKIEINYLLRLPILAPEIRRFQKFNYNIDFSCLSPHELLSGKVIALLSRYTPRDLFDVYQLASSPFEFDSQLVRSLLLFYGIVSKMEIFELFKLKFERITQSDIQNSLVPMLRKRTYIEGRELIAVAAKFLSPLLLLNDKEINVIKAFYKSGNLKYENLFPQKKLQEKIRKTPVLKWKIQNIKQNL